MTFVGDEDELEEPTLVERPLRVVEEDKPEFPPDACQHCGAFGGEHTIRNCPGKECSDPSCAKLHEGSRDGIEWFPIYSEDAVPYPRRRHPKGDRR